MTDTSAEPRRAGRDGRSGKDTPGQGRPGIFARIRLFFAQILDELRKVVRPTQAELVRYTTVVVAFVVTIMLLVSGLDYVLHRVVFFVFAGS